MQGLRTLATGLRFPEGPVANSDGTILLVEIAGGAVARIASTGTASTLAVTGGGPNGMAIGPDGALYVCNHGGNEYREGHFMGIGPARDYAGGYIQRIDAGSGNVRTLYTHCGANKLSAPNDIVFDREGGFYFTDMGKKHARYRDHGGIYYAQCDGTNIVEVAYPVLAPNGIGLSPDGKILYVTETETARLWSYKIMAPGVVKKLSPPSSPHGGSLVYGLPGYQQFDGLAVDAQGNICVATLITGHITVFSPAGQVMRQVKMPAEFPTNICFGGPDMRTAYITLSDVGQLIAMDWPQAGAPLNWAV